MSDARQHVRDLIHRLPRAQLAAIAGLLEVMLQPGKEDQVIPFKVTHNYWAEHIKLPAGALIRELRV